MQPGQLNWIVGYIWGIADDVLRDLYVRGKYRDVILPMTVLRRLDAVLEDSKQAALDMKAMLHQAGVVEQDSALRQAAGQAFYNTSRFTLRDLRSRARRQQLKANFEAYLDGFSPNVQDILDNFEFRNQIPRLSKADALATLIEKLTSPDVNLSPTPVLNEDGSIKHPALDNHGMGSIFEELVRKFNEENNEVTIDGKPCVVEYEPDTELRDTEQVSLKEPGGIAAFLERKSDSRASFGHCSPGLIGRSAGSTARCRPCRVLTCSSSCTSARKRFYRVRSRAPKAPCKPSWRQRTSSVVR